MADFTGRMVLVPQPMQVQARQGVCPGAGALRLPPQLAEFEEFDGCLIQTLSGIFDGAEDWPDIHFVQNPALAHESYELNVDEAGVSIAAAGAAGAFYALVTLGQMVLQGGGSIPCCHIADAPGLPIRGLMLDISRGKVPKLETLFALADKLALLKMNHLQLYIEGFSFAYPSFPEVWADGTPITPQEIQTLDVYCKQRFIELVPNQNSLGHMAHWLADPRFAHLAELPGGIDMMGFKAPPTTLDPENPGSLELVEKLTDDLLPNFTSNQFQTNMDEPFELGFGKSKTAKEEGRLGFVYLDYVKRLHAAVKKRGKRMMMWGDVLGKHPEILPEVPKDITVLEWGYEAEHPFEDRAAALQKAGLRFIACPGTSSWSSFSGITDNMLPDIRRAAEAAYAYGGRGLVVCDWGDGGHQQYLPVSYAAIMYAAAFGWAAAGITEGQLAAGLDAFVYRDAAGVTGGFSLALGRSAGFDEFAMPCRTLVYIVATGGLVPRAQWDKALDGFMASLTFFAPPVVAQAYQKKYAARGEFDYASLLAFLDEHEAAFAGQAMACGDAETVAREYANTITALRFFAHAHAWNAFAESWGKEEQRACLAAMAQTGPGLIAQHEALWHARNKAHGLEASTAPYARILAQAQDMLAAL